MSLRRWLCDGLRQGGVALRAVVYGRAEALPFHRT
jgi:hypothetical protein